MTLPIAHTGHWVVNALYLLPLLVVLAMLVVASIRDRRAEAAATRPSPRVAGDEHTAP